MLENEVPCRAAPRSLYGTRQPRPRELSAGPQVRSGRQGSVLVGAKQVPGRFAGRRQARFPFGLLRGFVT